MDTWNFGIFNQLMNSEDMILISSFSMKDTLRRHRLDFEDWHYFPNGYRLSNVYKYMPACRNNEGNCHFLSLRDIFHPYFFKFHFKYSLVILNITQHLLIITVWFSKIIEILTAPYLTRCLLQKALTHISTLGKN